MREVLEQRMALARVANDFLRDEANKLKEKLEESEQKLQRYKEEQNAVSLETPIRTLPWKSSRSLTRR